MLSALIVCEFILKELRLQVLRLCEKMKSNEENQENHGSESEEKEGDSEKGRRTRKGESKAEGQEFFKAIHEESQAKSREWEEGHQEEGCKANSSKYGRQTGREAEVFKFQ
ncbi:MAG: hypothetical protein VCB25_03880 [Myxococcota bacterium]